MKTVITLPLAALLLFSVASSHAEDYDAAWAEGQYREAAEVRAEAQERNYQSRMLQLEQQEVQELHRANDAAEERAVQNHRELMYQRLLDE